MCTLTIPYAMTCCIIDNLCAVGWFSYLFFTVRNFNIFDFNFQSVLLAVDSRCFPSAFLLCPIRFLVRNVIISLLTSAL